MTTAVTEPLVDAKDDAVKAELRLDMAQAVSEFLLALERQNAVIDRMGSEHTAAIERLRLEHVAAIERQGAHYERRLSIATYWLFGAIVAGHLTTLGVVVALLT